MSKININTSQINYTEEELESLIGLSKRERQLEKARLYNKAKQRIKNYKLKQKQKRFNEGSVRYG